VGQGFLFARPMSKEDLLTRISAATGKRRVEQARAWWQLGAVPTLRTG
jgi:hypothetical protein